MADGGLGLKGGRYGECVSATLSFYSLSHLRDTRANRHKQALIPTIFNVLGPVTEETELTDAEQSQPLLA